jgi:TPR repeat protein
VSQKFLVLESQMKHAIKSVSLAVSLLLANGSIAYAQDFEKGSEFYDKRDYAAALNEWRPLAEQGNAYAQSNLGVMYEGGQGITQDYKEAVKWYRLAAAQGVAGAQHNLGIMYDNGRGVTQDYTAAVKWYRLAAEQGYADAQSNLGVMYANGQGVIQNYVYAHMWFNIAAASGDGDALKNRDIAAGKMTAADISKAQDLARACVQKNFKGC